jgi:hypothetical protein
MLAAEGLGRVEVEVLYFEELSRFDGDRVRVALVTGESGGGSIVRSFVMSSPGERALLVVRLPFVRGSRSVPSAGKHTRHCSRVNVHIAICPHRQFAGAIHIPDSAPLELSIRVLL